MRNGSSRVMEEEVFEAEITPSPGNGALNFTLGASIAVAIVFLFLGIGIGQVVTDEIGSNQSVEWWQTPLHERHKMDLNMSQERSVLPPPSHCLLYTSPSPRDS